MLKKYKNIGVVAHDAGSGNIIAEWVKKNNKKNFIIKVSGPAKTIFESNKIKLKLNNTLNDIISQSDFILSGTSAKNKLDHKIRVLAKKNKILNAGLLDNWSLYKKGFLFKKRLILPDEIWVTDRKAKSIAINIFKNRNIKLKNNIYEQNILKKIKSQKMSKNNKVLYLLEPFKNNTQIKAIKKFFRLIKGIKNLKIIFRPHPSENLNKYKKVIKEFSTTRCIINKNTKLEKLISWSNTVVGCETYAMVLALKAKRKVYTLLPINNYKCKLPFKNIAIMESNSLVV